MYDESLWPIGVATVTLQRKLWAATVIIATPLHFHRHIVARSLAPGRPGDRGGFKTNKSF